MNRKKMGKNLKIAIIALIALILITALQLSYRSQQSIESEVSSSFFEKK